MSKGRITYSCLCCGFRIHLRPKNSDETAQLLDELQVVPNYCGQCGGFLHRLAVAGEVRA